MKENKIKCGGEYFIKKSRNYPFEKIIVFYMKKRVGKNSLIFTNKGMLRANELTNISCDYKECPCH